MLQDRLIKAFSEGLEISKDLVTDELSFQGIQEWDSVGHMTLIASLESEFDIMFDTDDVIDLSSVAVAKKILEKYGVGPF
ncbi:acyl carrier protein [Asticcacaulis sp. DXS10W]|uniref:Acyl carrier protein n=1 Tax=Asticcacaulis currens TaxID=2984210 RepID=A0ABT5I9H2_9CAUL|nr:acyl carrier protein [Asticcacaulis currens]MDC7692822.1 acyl carrier protein [Asticcacaulis currens]